MFEKREPVRVGKYYAKPGGQKLSVADGRRLFIVPELIDEPYACNIPEQEKFAYLMARRVGANVVEVLHPHEFDRPLPPGCAYWCRDARSYRRSELPHQSHRRADAHLFVLAVLFRDWDDCESNREEVSGLPVAFDFGEIGNPNLLSLSTYAEVLRTPHPGGHFAYTTTYGWRFSREQRPLLEEAVRAVESVGDAEIEDLGLLSGAAEVCPEIVNQVRTCRAGLRADVENLFDLLGDERPAVSQ